MKISESLSRQLATASFVATILVVMCHCDDCMVNKDGFVRFLGGIFTDANVANFFFLSGFFVARRFGDAHWYRTAIFNRLRSLGIPYFSWCVVYLGVYALASLFGFCRLQIYGARNVFGIGFLTPPIDFALWYVKTLFYFIAVAPLFFALQSKFRVAFPLIALALLAVKSSPFGGSPLFGFCFNLVGFVCFLMGAEVAFSKTMQNVFLRVGKWGGGYCG